MTAPKTLWLQFGPTGDFESVCDEPLGGHAPWVKLSDHQAAVAAAYEAAAQVAASHAKYTRVAIIEATAKAIVENLVSVTQTKTANAIEDAIRALATPDQIAALAAERAATVTVKPLVWDNRGYEWAWWADTALGRGTYQIRCEGGIGYLVDFDGVTIGEPHDTLEAAKAAAQADYDARIRSAITITNGADLAEIGGA